jgi:hypothetical protein
MADILSAAEAGPETKRRKASAESIRGLPSDLVSRMREDTLAWQAVGGLLIGAGTAVAPAPCSLLPYPWQAQLFEQAKSLAVPFNLLVDRVARDTEWLHCATRSVVAQARTPPPCAPARGPLSPPRRPRRRAHTPLPRMLSRAGCSSCRRRYTPRV